MSKVFVISDTHFGHEATCNVFKKNDGSPLRPFKTLEEMHSVFIKNWNSVVTQDDLVIHCGDVAFSGQDYDKIMPQLNGTKRLIRGNHDRFSEERYRKFFQRVEGVYLRDNYAFTHVPIHPDCLSRWKGNIHGHLHANLVMKEVMIDPGCGCHDAFPEKLPDTRYFNASCEQINFTPIEFDKIRKEYFNEEF